MNKRQQIVAAIQARFEAILVANGYTSDLGESVFEWRRDPVLVGEIPCVIFKDDDDDIKFDGAPLGMAHHNMKVRATAFVKGETSSTEARAMLADMTKAIGVDHRWGGLARQTVVNSNSIDIAVSGETIGSISVEFTVVYETTKWEI